MITLQNITLRRGLNLLLNQINWTIYHKQRIGMIGANGSGKSSLFALLQGEIEADDGELDIPRQIRFAHVAQETAAETKSALDFVLDGDKELRECEQALVLALEKHDNARIAALHEKLSILDAYTAPARAAQILAGLGFSQTEQQQSVNYFSGGWRVRLNLAKALMCRSDILLLDEPTNHLDLDAVYWLEQWLKKYTGTLLIISHDRDFLDQTVDHIAHISQQTLKIYSGNYSAYEKQRAADLMLQQAAYEKQQKHIAHLQNFIDRFKANATKARQAQSRVKAIERMDLVCAVQTESPFQFQFKQPEHCPHPLLQLQNVVIAYQEKTILSHINISLTPKDRIAILGPNGAGKSTLVKCLADQLQPAKGERIASSGLKIGYFAQHQVDQLHLTETPFDHFRKLAPHLMELEVRKFLGSFGFVGDRVFEPVKHFSGGEKSRLALALLVWQKPNLLLLDEPTNHLDLEMRQALSLALQEYEGAMILVSHDRFLVRTTTDQLLLVAEGALQDFSGDLNDYQQWLLDYRKQRTAYLTTEDKSDLSRKEQRQQAAMQREKRRPLEQKIKRLEEMLEKLEKEYNQIELNLADLSLYEAVNKDKLSTLLLSQANVKKEI
ncbi:MAG: ATP-binding cassette domain-containing protein, partial [Gammaproteobacteria bacterium]|nr:ATP-binding cassette domain-containing protein [Gammaproteobacteria bacterium]